MVFQPFRVDSLAHKQTSPPSEFVVLLDAAQTFIRVITHLEDDVVFGGTPPTILLQAGTAPPTAVDEGAGPVDVMGSGQVAVATAACERTPEDPDTYLVTVNHSAPSGPWLLQITNNEPETLSFTGFIAHENSETFQPWVQAQGVPKLGAVDQSFGSVMVRNLGSKVLNVTANPGDKFGSPDSTVTVFKVTKQIEPHDAAPIVLACPPLREVAFELSHDLEHVLKTDDPLRPLTKVRCRVIFPMLPPTHCRENDGCREFVRRMPPDEFQCENCFHDAGSHGLPPGPGPGSHPF